MKVAHLSSSVPPLFSVVCEEGVDEIDKVYSPLAPLPFSASLQRLFTPLAWAAALFAPEYAAEMVGILEAYGLGLALHGGVPVKKRRDIVNEFQNSRDYLPYMVFSVKAAGVGLNSSKT